MKQLLYLFSILFAVSCSNSKDCDVEYGEQFQIEYKEKVCFPDGQSIEILDIRDGYCPCNADCKNPGDLFAEIKVTETDGTETIKSVGQVLFVNEFYWFSSIKIEKFEYDYDQGDGILPDCDNEWDAQKVKLLLTITK